MKTETEYEYKSFVEYHVGDVLYRVTPVFRDEAKAGDITDKILRLILKDQEYLSMEP